MFTPVTDSLTSLHPLLSLQVTFKPDASTAEVHDEHIRGLLKVCVAVFAVRLVCLNAFSAASLLK